MLERLDVYKITSRPLITSGQCTVHEADFYAVLITLEHNIKDALSFSKIVRLGTLGNFQIRISSYCAEEERVNVHFFVASPVYYLDSIKVLILF